MIGFFIQIARTIEVYIQSILRDSIEILGICLECNTELIT